MNINTQCLRPQQAGQSATEKHKPMKVKTLEITMMLLASALWVTLALLPMFVEVVR